MQVVFELLGAVPPFVQVLAVALLGAFSALSVAGRLSPRVGAWLFDPDRDPGSRDHLVTYTLLPAGAFLLALGLVVFSWQPGLPWFRGMPVARIAGGAVLLLLGLAGATYSHVQLKRCAKKEPTLLTAWTLVGLLLGGLAAMVVGLVLALEG